MTRSIWHRRAVESVKTDVCIIGAGILGASTAYWLGRIRPDLDVQVLEARWPAFGASGRNAGFLLQGAVTDYVTDIEWYGLDRARRLRGFTYENRDRLLDEIPAAAFSFVPSGSMTIAGDAEEEARLVESAALLQADGFSGDFLPAGHVNEYLGSTGYRGGLFTPSGGMLDPVELVGQLLARSGAKVREGIRVDGARKGLVLADGLQLHADRIIMCAGPQLPTLVPESRSWVRPVRAQMLALMPKEPLELQTPVYSHEGYYYLRPDGNGRVLVGGARHLHVEAEVGFGLETTPELQRDLLHYAVEHFPQLKGAQVERRWAGTMGFSPDGLPFVGPCGDGLWCATGFTGHGMAYGFRSGQMLARLSTGLADDSADLFAPDRSLPAQVSPEGGAGG